jgi:Fic family protein
VDIDDYFTVPQDKRNVRYRKFNTNLAKNLANLFTDKELEIFEQGKRKFKNKFSTLDKTILKRELERFTIEFSWKSSQIEGNTYSLLETEELIKNKREAKGHGKEEATMILNHKVSFDTILKNKKSFKNITTSDIRTIHSVLIKDLGIKTGIREAAVGITGTKYLPLDNKHQIEDALNRLVKHLKKINILAEQALILLGMLSYIQPFADGNKRTARMVSNAILLANDYTLFHIEASMKLNTKKP